MMKLVNSIYNFFKINVLIFVGLFMFTTFIYFKFLRTRLPKDIPFNLSVIGFIILLEICIIYTYIIWVFIRPPKKPNENLKVIVDFLFEPLEALDNYLKSFNIIKFYYPKIFFWCATKGLYFFNKLIFELCFFFIPRIVLIFTFIIDIFYFSKLEYIYYVLVPMGIILFIHKYFIFSVNKFKAELIHNFKLYVVRIETRYEYGIHPSEWPENFDPDDEEDDDDDIPPTMTLDVDLFVNYYCKKFINEEDTPVIHDFINTKLYFKEYKTKEKYQYEIYKKKDDILKQELQEILYISILQKYLSNHNILKFLKIIIYSLYFICWLYILLKSVHTLNINDFFIFINSIWEEIPDPFSDTEVFSIFLVMVKNKKIRKKYENKFK